MENPETHTCPSCRCAAKTGAFFCERCGAALEKNSPSCSVGAQIKVYAVSALLPPFGLIYVRRYLKQPDRASRKIGWIALILTVVMTVATVWATVAAINFVNQSLNAMLGASISDPQTRWVAKIWADFLLFRSGIRYIAAFL